MLKLTIGYSILAAATALAAPTAGAAAENPQVAREVMAVVESQWAAERAGRPAMDQLATAAEDYSEFNPDNATLIVGKATNAELYDATAPMGKTLVSKMMNPHVQVYGDTAIVAYNFVGVTKNEAGKIVGASGNSTRVYVRQGGKWMLVHAHFSPVGAPAK